MKHHPYYEEVHNALMAEQRSLVYRGDWAGYRDWHKAVEALSDDLIDKLIESHADENWNVEIIEAARDRTPRDRWWT